MTLYTFRAFDNDNSSHVLFLHQTVTQQHLLVRYGNDMVLIDATYKTTAYDLPLFFVSVCTNSGYVVVATFITVDERSESIAEALTMLSTWNQSWQPECFMTDYSDSQLKAISSVFPGLLLCLFY